MIDEINRPSPNGDAQPPGLKESKLSLDEPTMDCDPFADGKCELSFRLA
jgi:hypothetical protein